MHAQNAIERVARVFATSEESSESILLWNIEVER